MASNTKQLLVDLSPVIKVYEDGTVERLFGSPHVPPSPEDPSTGVSSKDITILPGLFARLYLAKEILLSSQKVPILVYYHSGAFCLESAFSFLHHRYVNVLASESKALIISVEYRLAPEYPLPIAYEDSWNALQWAIRHAHKDLNNSSIQKEPWLIKHAEFNKVFIGGDSAGGNIVHNIAIRAGKEPLFSSTNVKILGAFLSHPYFLGSKPLDSEAKREDFGLSLLHKIWLFVYPGVPGGADNPMINPFAERDAPNLSSLGCKKLLVCVAEEDETTARGIHYVEVVKKSGWEGEVELLHVERENHIFHIMNPDSDKAKVMIRKLANFISQ